MTKVSSLGTCAAVVAAIACSGTPNVDSAAEADAIRQRFADWVEAENRRDLEASVSFLTADAIIHAAGVPAMQGLDAARDVWSGMFEIPYSVIEDVEPRTVVVAASGDMAYDIGNWRLVLPSDSGTTEEKGKSAIIWQKRDGEWMAVAITFSMDAPAASPEP